MLAAQHPGFIMATFHEGLSGRKKETTSDDSPYHIFTPDDIQHQDDTAVMYSISTFQPRQVYYQGTSTNSKIPCMHSGLNSTEESVSSSLPRHGSHGSKTASLIPSMGMSQRNRSVDNVSASFVKSLPPRGQYYPSSFTKALPPRQIHHGSISNTADNFLSKHPKEGSTIVSPSPPKQCNKYMTTSGRKTSHMYIDDKIKDDSSKPTPKHLHVSEEYDQLLPPETNITDAPNVVHRNAAYEGVVCRPFTETAYNSPVFETEPEHDQIGITHVGNWPSPPSCGSETNYFEMCSDDSLKNDQGELKAENEQEKIAKASQHPFNDYENVKEYIPSSPFSDSNITPLMESKLFHTVGVQNQGSDGQKSGNTCTNVLNAHKHLPDYENVKDYNQCPNTECNTTSEWISLAAIPNTLPKLVAEDESNQEQSIQTAVPKIIIQAEHINETASQHQTTEQGNIASLGKDLRKSADLETLSDYEEMASSFSSHYTAVKSNQKQPFPFLSSIEVEGPTTLRVQEDEQHNNMDGTNSMENIQHNEQTGSEPTAKYNIPAHVPAPKTKKEKCFQYCLIFITLAIAIAALVISTKLFIDIESSKNNTISF